MAKKIIEATQKVKPKPPIKKKYIETPELLWELFCAYRDELKENPITIIEQKKGNTILPKGLTAEEFKMYANTIIELPAQRPLTFEGFQNYLEENEIITDVTDYFENKGNRYKAYIRVCKRVKRVIRQDQIEGGMAGIYNPSITQRLNGLVEKTQQDTTIRLGKDLEEEKYE